MSTSSSIMRRGEVVVCSHTITENCHERHCSSLIAICLNCRQPSFMNASENKYKIFQGSYTFYFNELNVVGIVFIFYR